MSRRTRRWLLAGAALVALEATYLVAANRYLRSDAVRALANRHPDKVRVEWSGAWTWLPGVVSLDDLRLTGQSPRLRWAAELDRVWAVIDLWALRRRSFHTLWVGGEGLAVRLRPVPATAVGDKAAPPEPPPGLPPLPDLAPSPPTSSPAAPVARAPRRPWSIHLGGVHLREVREVWIERYRVTGTGRLDLDLAFQPHGPLEVEALDLKIRADALVRADEAIAEAVALTLRGHLEPVVPGASSGGDVLRRVSARVGIRGTVPSLAFLDRALFAATPWIDLSGRGELDADLLLEGGELLAGSRVDVDRAAVEARYLAYRAEGEGTIHTIVEPSADGRLARMVLEMTRFELGLEGAPHPHVHGSGFRLTAVSHDLDPPVQAPRLEVTVDLPPSEVPDLRAYNAYLPGGSGLTIRSGSGQVRGHLELSTIDRSGRGEVEVSAERCQARLADLPVTTGFTLVSHLDHADLERRRFDLSGSRLALRDLAVDGSSTVRGWWADAELRQGTVALGPPLALDASLTAALRDSGPLVVYLARKKPALGWLDELLTVRDIRASGRLRLDRDGLLLRRAEVFGEHLRLRTELTFAGDRHRGVAYLRYGPAAVGVAIDGAERDWKLWRPGRWFEEQTGWRLPAGGEADP